MSNREYYPGHYDGDGCVFPDPGHLRPVNYGGRAVAASTPLRSLVRLDANPDTAITELANMRPEEK